MVNVLSTFDREMGFEFHGAFVFFLQGANDFKAGEDGFVGPFVVGCPVDLKLRIRRVFQVLGVFHTESRIPRAHQCFWSFRQFFAANKGFTTFAIGFGISAVTFHSGKPNNIFMKKKEKVAIGLDVGGTKIAAGLITESGKILAYYKIPTFDEAKPSVASFIDRLVFLYDQLSQDAKNLGVQVAGVGLASTGPMNVNTGELIQPANLHGIKKIEVCKLFLKKRKTKLYFQNDAMAAAIAERRWGAAQKTNNSVMITVGTGIGAGTLVNGLPLQNHGIGSEWGHCLLGELSVEQISAGPALKKRAEKLVKRKIERLDEIPVKILRSPKNKKKVFGPTSTALAQLCRNLSIGVAPEVISFAGGVFDYGNFFWPELKAEYHGLMKNFKMFEAELVRSKVKHASLMGAACLVFEQVSAFPKAH